jgi:uncharacterized iron-regulated membrane protein
MKLNCFTKRLSVVGRWMATTLFCLAAIALVWQGAWFSNITAMADPTVQVIAARDAGDQVKDKVNEDTGRAKSFIRDTKEQVERTARNNASRVDRADDKGSFVERKAQRDAARIHKRAEEDAARTEKAVDNTRNVIERTVDNIKDALSD